MKKQLAHRWFWSGVLIVSAQMALGAAAVAQTGIEVPTRDTVIGRGETVTNRPRPDFDPLGVRAGSFIILPSVRLQEEYSDNIFSTQTGEQSDFISTVSPQLIVQSDWGNHMLRLDGGADVAFYNDNDDENFEDYRFGASGRVDVTRQTKIRPRVSYRQGHSDRSSPNDAGGIEPTIFDVMSAGLEGSHKFNRLSVTVGGTFDQYDYDDVATGAGGTINNDDRDREDLEASVRLGYEVSPNYEGFVRGAYNIRDYDSAVDDSGINRDSDGVEIVAGVGIDFGGITFGEFFAGYRAQDYDDPMLETASGPIVGADIIWNVTQLTTVTGSISREIRESTTQDPVTGNFASGRFFSTVGVAVDHELRRNVLLGANVSASQDDFQGIDRTDNIYRAGISARYFLNRYANVGGQYRLRMRDSDAAGADFTENQFLLNLRVQY
jgi:hypothetical protein